MKLIISMAILIAFWTPAWGSGTEPSSCDEALSLTQFKEQISTMTELEEALAKTPLRLQDTGLTQQQMAAIRNYNDSVEKLKTSWVKSVSDHVFRILRGDPIPGPSFYVLHRKEGEANQVILLVGIPNLVKDLQKIALENFVENFGVVAIPGEDPEISREQGERYFKPLNEDDPEDDQRRGLKNYLKDSLGKLVHGVYNLIRNVPEKAAIKLGLYHAPIYEHPEKMTEKGKAVYYTENKYTPTSAELFSRFGGDARLTAWTASAATAFYQIVDIYLHGSDRPSDVYSYSAVLIGLSYLAATAMDLPERLSAKLKERGGWPRRHTPLKVLRALFGYESRKRNSSVVFRTPEIAKQVVQKIIPELKMEDGDYAPLILIVDKNTVANLGYELVLQSKEEAKYNFLPVKID